MANASIVHRSCWSRTHITLLRGFCAGLTLALAAPCVASAAESLAAAPPAAATPTTSMSDAPVAARGDAKPPHGRTLNGHTFQPSAIVPGALITTSFASALVVGYGSTSTTFTVGDREFSGSFDFAGVGGFLAYEYAFLDWLSARFSITEQMFSGIDGKSAIAIGTEAQGGATLGLVASMPLADSLRVGVLLDAGIRPALSLTIGQGLQGVIDSCEAGDCNTDTETIFGLNKATVVQPAVAANWAPTRAFGVTANLAYLHLSSDLNDDTFSGQAAVLSTALEYDFRMVSSVPIALQAAISWTAPIAGEGLQHVTDVGGGIFYTGREHLSAGVQIVQRRFAVAEDLPTDWSATLATTGLRYYW
jgi:hypothetical protein